MRPGHSFVSFAQPGQLFEDLGITYVGVVPGHDLRALVHTFRSALDLGGPVLVHVRTQKGRGFEAERTVSGQARSEAPFLRRGRDRPGGQERLDAEAALVRAEATEDFAAFETAFVEHAKPYSERKGISYSAWRESGVPAEVLRRAGIPRTRG